MIDEFLNPNNQDVFNEEEAGYYYSFLRRKISNTEFVIDDNNRPLFEKMYFKAKKSVKILSEHLNLTIDDFNDNHEASQASIDQIDRKSNFDKSPRQPIIFRNQKYQEVTMDSLLKLLLRIKHLFWAIQEIIKILSIILKLKDLIGYEDMNIKGQVYEIIEKYDKLEDKKKKLDFQEENILIQSLNKFVMVSRRISRFLKEHKLFKHFVFGNSKYQTILLQHATNICDFFKRRGRRELRKKYGEAFISDFLQFNEVEVEESEKSQVHINIQDADEIQDQQFEMEIENLYDKSQKSGQQNQSQKSEKYEKSQKSGIHNQSQKSRQSDKSQQSEKNECFKSDLDLRKPKKESGSEAYHFGMLSQRSDSQENIQTVNDECSMKIERHRLFSQGERSNNSNIQQTDMNTQGISPKNNQTKNVQHHLGMEKDILSSDSKMTHFVENIQNNIFKIKNMKLIESNEYSAGNTNQLPTIDKDDQYTVKNLSKENLKQGKVDQNLKEDDEESNATHKQPLIKL